MQKDIKRHMVWCFQVIRSFWFLWSSVSSGLPASLFLLHFSPKSFLVCLLCPLFGLRISVNLSPPALSSNLKKIAQTAIFQQQLPWFTTLLIVAVLLLRLIPFLPRNLYLTSTEPCLSTRDTHTCKQYMTIYIFIMHLFPSTKEDKPHAFLRNTSTSKGQVQCMDVYLYVSVCTGELITLAAPSIHPLPLPFLLLCLIHLLVLLSHITEGR